MLSSQNYDGNCESIQWKILLFAYCEFSPCTGDGVPVLLLRWILAYALFENFSFSHVSFFHSEIHPQYRVLTRAKEISVMATLLNLQEESQRGSTEYTQCGNCHLLEKLVWWGTGVNAHPLSLYLPSRTVVLDAPAERTEILPLFLLYPYGLCVLCEGAVEVRILVLLSK